MSDVVSRYLMKTLFNFYSQNLRFELNFQVSYASAAARVFPVNEVLRKCWQMLAVEFNKPDERNSFYCSIHYAFCTAVSLRFALAENVKFAWSCRELRALKIFHENKNVSHQSPRKINCLIVTNNSEQKSSNGEGSKRRLSWWVAVNMLSGLN